ncbi:MAG: DNA repair protein RecN [Oscillospiraceae bacterium]|nr:DNA repair protein RecN [Oscillospiraceae bacterium]
MLTHLSIKNIAVIDRAQIDFSDGFNILTGETGAGKSIIINSLNILKGERASKELIRTGEQSARVDGIFTVSDEIKNEICDIIGIDFDENEIMISREFNLDGKNSVRINGSPITLSMLKSIGEYFVNIHGQHDSTSLLVKKSHLGFLDDFGGDKLKDALEEYKKVHAEYQDVKSKLEKLNTDETEKERRMDLLKYQIEEIEVANLSLNEEDDLTERRNFLANAQKISENCLAAFDKLYDGEETGNSAHDLIWEAVKLIEQITEFNSDMDTVCKELTDVTYIISDNSHAIKKFADSLECNEYELNEIEERLDVIYNLKRKYGVSVGDVLKYLEKIKKEYAEIEHSEEQIKFLSEKLKELELSRLEKAEKLSLLRKENAKILSEKICAELCDLEMAKTVFEVKIEDTEFSNSGKDDVEFLISTNLGELPKPLSKIASGGELSRIILAIKSVITGGKSAETLIFDEVDTGVSGKTAQKIGEKLYKMTKSAQVICITHLAQIASLADKHFLIEKKTENGRTKTEIMTIDGENRILEIARILGGEVITDLTRENAKEQILLANDIKKKIKN